MDAQIFQILPSFGGQSPDDDSGLYVFPVHEQNFEEVVRKKEHFFVSYFSTRPGPPLSSLRASVSFLHRVITNRH